MKDPKETAKNILAEQLLNDLMALKGLQDME
jgi:hypothetical protein